MGYGRRMVGEDRTTWQELDADLDAEPGTVSVYVGRLDHPPAYARLPQVPHYAASTMKAAVLAALYRTAEAGSVDLDAPVPVHNTFASALPGAACFGCSPEYDNDPLVWARLDGQAPLRWLARRMIIQSSNLAANLVIDRIGLPAVAEVWHQVGARHSVTARGIEDFAARDAGLENLVTAADLAALLDAIATGRLAGAAACADMLDVLLAQERREDLAAGLPPGTRIAHKNGWVRGIRHAAGVVFPDDAPPYAVVVCTSVDPGVRDRDAAARALIARVSRVAWCTRTGLARVG